MGPQRPRSVVLNAGALIAFERNVPRVRRLVELAHESGADIHVAAGVIAQVWRDGRRQARLARLLRSPTVRVQPLDLDEAKAAGIVAGRAGVSDVIDSSVALLARRTASVVVTSDPDDIVRLDPSLVVITC